MNNQFDELAKGMARSVSRRGALKKFSVGLAGIALAALGMPHKAEADPRHQTACISAGAICCYGLKPGQASKCERLCRQQCCSGAFSAPNPGVFVCL